MGNLSLALILLSSAVVVFSGSLCPERARIYPCACIYVHNGRRSFQTLLICNGLKDKEELSTILKHFSNLVVDKFFMYDSYWGIDNPESGSQAILPKELFSLPVQEIEVIDSKLNSCFACEWDSCDNTHLTRLKVRNSTSDENFCSFCRDGSRLPWMTCTDKLEHLESSYGNIKRINVDFFPTTVNTLKVLDFSHNEISKIEEGVFRNVPHLQRLDLSYNNLDRVDRIFNARTELEFIDLSHNKVTVIGLTLIPAIPKAKLLSLANNQIRDLRPSDWRRVPRNITRIDLSNNLVHCDCNLQWVNHTFTIRTVIDGNCATPEVYANTRIRRASIYLNQRCDANNNIGSRQRS